MRKIKGCAVQILSMMNRLLRAKCCGLLLLVGFAAGAAGQGPETAAVSGTVVDPSGAAIVRAAVHLHYGQTDLDAATDGSGHFQIVVPAATYDVTVAADGFRQYDRAGLVVLARVPTVLTIKLEIAAAEQQVEVSSEGGASTSAADNGSALVFKADDLQALSDDPNALQQQLLALSGNDPSSPSGIYVDGFSNGTLPPKESIREIRINQNPFTSQYEDFGLGRIEVFTKPGSDRLHGSFDAYVGTSALNARNPYTGPQPAYINDFFNGSLNGPVGKKTSFYLTGRRFDLPANAVINATTLDANLQPVMISQPVANLRVSQTYSLRGDRQFGTTDTAIGRYTFADVSEPNLGIGSLILPSQASTSDTRTQTLQLTDTHLFNAKVVSEMAAQYIRTRQRQDGISSAPSIIVQGGFSAGGSPSQTLHDDQDRLELRDYLSIATGKHFVRTGVRYRLTRDANLNTANYNGQYIFSSLTAFQITQQGLRDHLTDAQIRATCLTGTDGTSTCGGASQFSLTTGDPQATISTGDVAVYAEDEWRARTGLTLNYGVRVESQSAVPDHFDLAPRLGFAYSVKTERAKAPMFVVRGGFGIFFTRFDSTYLLQAQRQNGIQQKADLITNPVYACAVMTTLPCLTPDLSQATGEAASATIYRVSPDLRAPIQMQGLVTVEREMGKRGKVSVNYYHLRRTHLYELLNVNAPLPLTGERPMGGTENVYQYSSEGISKWYLFSSNLTLNLNKYANFWAYGSLGHREQDAFGPDQFPSNSYNLGADLGTPTTYAAEQFFGGGWIRPGRDVTLSFLIGAYGRTHFNITTGQDNNGDSIYNDRPAFATDLTRPSVVRTVYGIFDTNPLPGQATIPFNYGHTPAALYTEISAEKSFRVGPLRAAGVQPAAGGSGKQATAPVRPYQVQFGIEVDNVLNNVNPGTPVGVLTSPLFGRSLVLNSQFTANSAANRALLFHTKFSF